MTDAITSPRRHPAIERVLEGASPGQAERRAEGKCATCGSDRMRPTNFTDDLSRKEAGISGMCQRCQNVVFSDPAADANEAVADLLTVVNRLVELLRPHETDDSAEITIALNKTAIAVGAATLWLGENSDEDHDDQPDEAAF